MASRESPETPLYGDLVMCQLNYPGHESENGVFVCGQAHTCNRILGSGAIDANSYVRGGYLTSVK